LTGTFTDLGIDLARLAASREGHSPDLRSQISLKAIIILSFITGALSGALSSGVFIFTLFMYPS
jgi:uncharacterized membrane protein YoaK (UPF0700 family)